MEFRNVVINGIKKEKVGLELGYMICKRCGSIIATLPTNRVKRYYSECSEGCSDEYLGVKEFD
ncbi:GapA-binding peptide SR1P [Paenibacillus sp. LHD-38]|uniref:GapA-binding peptide SR1P n=1 Tax=Paenibacillus sp. LHD-38 TaxID=3072143 RepID=UPI00280E004B|nr:GapA-binding peptide SR1P [Paenibacillus sp. LHD-38]MDQ8738446.1 GapA-binding peptide SR1P [Paenibacillus sp. LHD-38]